MEGQVDYRSTTRDGKPAVEFSWEGGDAADGTPLTGRGWAVLDGDDLTGMFFTRLGAGFAGIRSIISAAAAVKNRIFIETMRPPSFVDVRRTREVLENGLGEVP